MAVTSPQANALILSLSKDETDPTNQARDLSGINPSGRYTG